LLLFLLFIACQAYEWEENFEIRHNKQLRCRKCQDLKHFSLIKPNVLR